MTNPINLTPVIFNTVNMAPSDSSPDIGVTGGRSFTAKAGTPARAALRLFNKLAQKVRDLFARLIGTSNKTPSRARAEESSPVVAMRTGGHSALTAADPAIVRSRRASASFTSGLQASDPTAAHAQTKAMNRRHTAEFTGVITPPAGDTAPGERVSIASLSRTGSFASIGLPVSDATQSDSWSSAVAVSENIAQPAIAVAKNLPGPDAAIAPAVRSSAPPPAPPLPVGGLNLRSEISDPLAALRARKRENAAANGAAGSLPPALKGAAKAAKSIMDDTGFQQKLKAQLAKLGPPDEDDTVQEKTATPSPRSAAAEPLAVADAAPLAAAPTLKQSGPPPAPPLPPGGLNLRPSAGDPLAALRARKQGAADKGAADQGAADQGAADAGGKSERTARADGPVGKQAAKSIGNDPEFKQKLAARLARLP